MSFSLPLVFLSNSGVHTVSWTIPFIWTTGVYCSNSVNHDRAQVFIGSLTCCWDWTCNLQTISLRSTFKPNALSIVLYVPAERRRTYRLKRCDYTNKDEVNIPNILSNNNYQSSSQKFRQIKLKSFTSSCRAVTIPSRLGSYSSSKF